MNLIDGLRAFARVAQCGSFSLAADQMGLGQPNLSKLVAALERHLAVKLLSRTTRRVKLTSEGVTYLAYAQRILDQVEEAEGQVGKASRIPSGVVRIGSPYAFAQRYLVERAAKLLALYPLIKIEMLVSDLSPNLVEQDIDIAIRLGQVTGDLTAKRIGTASRVAVASPDYLRRRGVPATPADLAQHQCLVFANPTIGRGWTFNWPDGRITTDVSGSFASNSAQLIRDACLSGLGIAVMPEWLFDKSLHAGEVTRILTKFEPQGLPVWLVHRMGRYVPLKIRAVFDFLFTELRRELTASSKRR